MFTMSQNQKAINLIAICILLNISPGYSVVTYRFVQGNYKVSGKGTCIDPFMTIKPLNRESTSLSAGCRLLSRPLNKINMSVNMEYKRNFGNYRQLMTIPSFDLCERAKIISHPFISFLLQYIIPTLLDKKCPLMGEDFKAYNLSRQPDVLCVYPDGYYRTVLTFQDQLDDTIFNSTTTLKVKNTNNIKEF